MKDVFDALDFMINREEPISVILKALNNAFFITHDESYNDNMNMELMFDDLSSECLYWKSCVNHAYLIENIIDLVNSGTLITDIHIRSDNNDSEIIIDPNRISNEEIEEYNYNLSLFNETKDELYLEKAMEIMYYKDPIACNILHAYLNALDKVLIYLINKNEEENGKVMIKRFLHFIKKDKEYKHELNELETMKFLKHAYMIIKDDMDLDIKELFLDILDNQKLEILFN